MEFQELLIIFIPKTCNGFISDYFSSLLILNFMSNQWIVFLFFWTVVYCVNAQNNVGIGTMTPNPRALMDLTASDKGLLIPRLTPAQRLSVPVTSAENGLLVYDVGDSSFYYWNMSQWVRFPLPSYNYTLGYNNASQLLSLTDGGGTLTVPLNMFNSTLVFNPATQSLSVTDAGGTLTTPLSVYNSSLTFNNTSQTLSVADAGGLLSVSLSSLTNNALVFDSLTNQLTLTDGGGSLTTTLNINTDDFDWTRNTANGTMHPSTLTDRIGLGTTTTNPSALLELQSGTQGFLTSRMTTVQRLAIAAPPSGLEVFDTDAGVKMYYNGVRWLEIGAVPIGSVQAWHKSAAGTPVLPWGWVECNGQLIADAESPYNGTNAPDLNPGSRFLRGSSVSGTYQAEDFAGHTHTGTTAVDGNHTHDIDPPATTTSASGVHSHTGTTGNVNSGNNGVWIPYDDNTSDNCEGDWTDDNASQCGSGWNGKNTSGNFLGRIDGPCLNHSHSIPADGNHDHTLDTGLFQSGSNGSHTHSFTSDVSGGTETRPVNMSVVWIFRVK